MRYVSINEVFAKVKSDLGITDLAINVSDWVTWTSEALMKIGAHPEYVNRIIGVRDQFGYNEILEINDYQVEVPCDLIRINAVAIGMSSTGGFTACRKATGPFDVRQSYISVDNKRETNIDPIVGSLAEKLTFVRDVFSESTREAMARLNSDPHLNNVLDLTFLTDGNTLTRGMLGEYVYNEQLPYLRFNVSNGYCIISYQALPTDEDGYPLIPDDEDLKEAIFWYINMKLRYIDYVKRIEGAKDLYKDAQYEWKCKKLAAFGNLMMPKGVDDMKTFQGIWLRMIPKINEHQTGYKNIGSSEKLYTRL